MPRKKRPEPDDKEQSARFIETAERIGVENVKEVLDSAVKSIKLKQTGKKGFKI